MMETILLLLYYLILYLYGMTLSFAFCGSGFSESNRKTRVYPTIISLFLQLLSWLILGEEFTWMVYPLIAHLPIIYILHKYYNQSIINSITAVSIAYLFCQPAKWMGIMFLSLTGDQNFAILIQMLTLLMIGYIIKSNENKYDYTLILKSEMPINIFSIVPISYYIYDYTTHIYSDYIYTHADVMVEFLPFGLFVSYFAFMIHYQYEYHQKVLDKRNMQMTHILLTQQRKEIEAIKKSNEEVRLLRHDMRHITNNLIYLLSENNVEAALKVVESYNQQIEATYVKYYCENEMVNYIISNYASICEQKNIQFVMDIQVPPVIHIDETILISILSNALENAVLAQPNTNKKIHLFIRYKNDNLLISIKNPFQTCPVFVDGVPISHQDGHGYGTRSIKHLSESVGGTCEFSIKDDLFVVNVIL